ncbi:VCBS repeat-containing protein [Flavitalea sp. BT771]|uniref:VCBS repeat-containing protein n=1 Tax=Flavitalea sp. BT771 TaxID=3063329 RepID=UPI0026E25F1A|nr:VCBS repeat-containing protein [Flavitalea sp. BT771]MDO6430319.1 VCBS repeat-containing protein [Flavitalea sp. BT771]MDV6219541.1 VCBS repeat-containing protein [Flavitalea sp. BT771]
MSFPACPYPRLWLLCIAVTFFSACRQQPKNSLFTQLQPDASGIHFRNDLNDGDSSSSFINEFGYMGGGVGIGDFNNDGLKDIFFTANQGSCRLYVNKGSNKWEDISERAGVTTKVWATGVSVVDINNDGYDDIYICVLGKDLAHPAKNLLFINQHDLTFKEEAEEYGLAFSGYSTQAVFLDYDRDGDLDMYLVNYLIGNYTNTIIPRNRSGSSAANDRLYRNEGPSKLKGHPVFTDVTLQAGIKEDGYGLGVTVSDFNNDGWPDIYVANDFLSNDDLWLNCRNGTFTNCISRSLQHQSYSSMGTDAADINNDGLPDIVTLDMLPEYNRRKKESFFFMNYDRYQAERDMGYEPEFMRNMLQLNNGCIHGGDTSIPYFSEIGQLAGIESTDWSWSVLMADFNNDGWKDIHVTNGIGRDFINADFLEFSSKIFGSNKTRQEQEALIRKRLAELDHVNLPNYLYLNQGNYSFADASAGAGIDEPSMSNGAAYADLDNDGDLDLVVNNIDKEAFVFLNNTVQQGKVPEAHFLSLRLAGDSLNTHGFGAKVCVYSDGRMQMQEENPVRGYFSSVDQQLLFGLGRSRRVDSIKVIWPDSNLQEIRNIPADTFMTLSWKNAVKVPPASPVDAPALFSDVTSSSGIVYRHHENPFNDFALQRLLPHKYSQLGPFITTGDINGDGAMDFFIGGAFNFSGKLFTQGKDQSFMSKSLVDSIKMEEDMGCTLFDADGDGDLDLLVTGGDIQYEEGSVFYKPRLYINDGKGNFSLSKNALPDNVRTIAGCVTAADLDGDGDLDLFIGGRVAKEYPLSPRSFILRNDKGVFTDVTAKVCPGLEKGGMITAAVWMDFNHDKQMDLVVAGEWMPVQFFVNDRGVLHETTEATGLTNMHGMWKSLIAADVDNDGDLDLVAGNLGLNCDYHVSATTPMELFAADIDGNGRIDPVLFYYIRDVDSVKRSYPAFSRSQLAMQVPAVKKRFLLYEDYAKAGFEDIFPGKKKADVLSFYCDETRSCWLENRGNGKFIKHILPVEAQFAPVNAIICEDIDEDGYRDLLLAGNDYQSDVITGRYDASYGCFLRGSREKQFTFVPPARSGFVLKGDVKDMALIRLGKKEKIIVAAVNDDSLRTFRINVPKLKK